MIRFAPLLLALACGCPHQPPPNPATVDDIALGLSLAAELADALAEDAKEPGGCVAGRAIASASRSALAGLGGEVIPGLRIDVSGCGLDARAVDVPAWVYPVGRVAIRAVAVPAWVDPVGRVAVRAASSIAARGECPGSGWASAVIEYVGAAKAEILAELRDPNGIIEIPEVRVSPCGE